MDKISIKTAPSQSVLNFTQHTTSIDNSSCHPLEKISKKKISNFQKKNNY